MATARYDRIGHGYAATRRPDPRLRALIDRELGDARTVVDVGAGTGSYEPAGRHVVAIEPSDVMAAQRASHLAPALRADAAHLPVRDASVDAALAVLTVHHWGRDAEAGVRELRRVAAGPVLIVTFDTEITQELWMIRDYLPEIAEQDRRDFPALDPAVTAATSGFARLTPEVRARAIAALERDLASGEWDRRNGALRSQDALDAGQRLLVHRPAETRDA
jgi:SAM-dependent methyltransferase